MKRVALVVALVSLLASCGRVTVMETWASGNPRVVHIEDGDHVDRGIPGAYDDACVAMGGPPSPCQDWGWNEPMNIYWVHIVEKECQGVDGSCVWVVTLDVWEHHFCGMYWPWAVCTDRYYPRAGFVQ